MKREFSERGRMSIKQNPYIKYEDHSLLERTYVRMNIQVEKNASQQISKQVA